MERNLELGQTQQHVSDSFFYLYRRSLHPELMAVSFTSDLALLGLPGEWFVETVAEIREEVAVRQLPVACYANHYMGYVVPEAAYEEGGYEPGVSLLAPEAEAIAKTAAIDLMKEVLQ